MPLPVLEDGLLDPAGRRMEYLRLSITDACNFRCVYCLPQGWAGPSNTQDVLTPDEVETLVRGLVPLGLTKVRLTGGEPTVRKDLLELVERVAGVPGIGMVALSTNGWNLARQAQALRAAGLQRVNVSVDSLDRQTFAAITGRDLLQLVLDGVDAALDAGLQVKVNSVLLREFSHATLETMLDYVRARPVTVRVIELMRTGDNGPFFLQQHVPLDALLGELLALGFVPRPRQRGDGPAQEFVHPQWRGGLGLIAPYRKDFCQSCNRLRVTSRGELRLCLFGDGNAPLRDLLQPGRQTQLAARVVSLLAGKPPSHHLQEERTGNACNLAQMGG